MVTDNKKNNKCSKVSLEEKESFITIDYYAKVLNIYSTRFATNNKLHKILGEPKRADGSYMEWDISFSKRNLIKKALSLGILLPIKNTD